jgi:hypothetical protein
LVDALPGHGAVGGDDEERDMQSGAVEAVAVLDEIVFAELFAVVADDDDERVFEVAAGLEALEECADAAVESAEAVIVGVADEVETFGVGIGLGFQRAADAPKKDRALFGP